jgi:NADP-dependent 3-hydroxy acid dehydrogenase YdfG
MTTLAKEVVIVTGGGSGVGKATVQAFRQHGAKVALAGRDEAKLQTVIQELGGGPDLVAIRCDVSQPADCENLIQAAEAKLGPTTILVNNAGMNLKARTIRELTPEAWDEMVRVNLNGAFYCTRSVLPGMVERKYGLILNVVSIAGLRANPLGGAAYVAAKHGMGAFGTVLANEERENGIRVCNICPGEIDTPILEQRPRAVTADQRAVILQPEDVAAAILFVAQLPGRVSVPEIVLKPTVHPYW